jgi:uncharacterized protein (DUF2252 family)
VIDIDSPSDPEVQWTGPVDLTSGRMDLENRRALGRAARRAAPRPSLAALPAEGMRADLIDLMRGQLTQRSADLIDERNRRMGESPFAFLRGSALRMADDLSRTPHSGLLTQLCGDAHLSNFGVYAAPDRRLVFDINDFDETACGPFEWDVKRLATSIAVAAEANGLDVAEQRELAESAAFEYAQQTAVYAEFATMDLWYTRFDETLLDTVAAAERAALRAQVKRSLAKARSRTSLQARDKLTTRVNGRHRFVDDPPLLIRITDQLTQAELTSELEAYRQTLSADRRRLLERFTVVDVARKVVGVGSVGLLSLLVLLEGRDEDDVLILQMKQAMPSVLAAYVQQHQTEPAHEGKRVVDGQQLMQATSDLMLGWTTGPRRGRHFYWRQFRDMKGSANVASLDAARLGLYGQLCARTLARAHAKAGDAVAVAAYLGGGRRFARAIGEWAMGYVDLNDADHRRFCEAVDLGLLHRRLGLPPG